MQSKKKTGGLFGMGAKKNDSSGSESDAEMGAAMMDECDDYGDARME